MPGAYLIALVVSLAGLTAADYRWRLALFENSKRTLATIGLGVASFLIWDLLGIGFGVFFEGRSPYLLGINVLPQVPLEELFFLTLLCYTLLLSYLGFSRVTKGVR
jgi:lycopene cyclase domain-containing protein